MVAPQVRFREIDQSDYVAGASPTRLLIVGGATKGPLNVVTEVRGEQDFINKFGKPTPTDYGAYAALMALQRTTRISYLRVADAGTVDTATVTVEDAGAVDLFDINALSPGSGIIDVVVAAGSAAGLWNLTVRAPIDNANPPTIGDVEQFVDVSLDPLNARYIETLVNSGSNALGVTKSEYIEIDWIANGTPVTGTYSLAGGDDGIAGLSAADYIGQLVGQTPTGLKAALDYDKYQIDVVAIPGVSDPAVINGSPGSLFEFLDQRRFTFGVIDPPMGLGVDDVIAWHNGTAPYVHTAFTSNRAAAYWPWARINDNYNGQEILVPPSCFALAQLAYSDEVSAPWIAPAGLKRGVLRNVISLEYSPSPAERDSLYGDGNAINPIVDYDNLGIVIWGQRTLQRIPTSLDRIDTRRMLLHVEYRVYQSCKTLVFEKNDVILWNTFKNLVNPILAEVKSGRGLDDYRVIADAQTNTPAVRARNEFIGRVLLKPTPTAEIITVEFTLTPLGVSFKE